jgi:peptide/nickel transport system substrate-binding protein
MQALTRIAATWRGFVCAAAMALACAEPTCALAQGGTLTYANPSGPSTLDPYMAGAVVEMEVVNQIYEGLVTLDEAYNPRLMLAEKLEIDRDARVFTFKLRQNVKFHNGQSMTSTDVIASFERYAAISPNATILSGATFIAVDSYTFVVKFEQSNPTFIMALSTPLYPVMILPADQKSKPGREAETIGTGPFRVEEWRKDDHLILAKFDGYSPDMRDSGPDGFGGRKTVLLSKVRYNFVPEANARVAALQSGSADVISGIPPELAARFAGNRGITKQETFPWAQAAFFMQTQNAPTNNVLVRRAIQAVVNVDDIMGATGQLARRNPSLIYTTSPYYDERTAAPYYGNSNIEKAKALLQEAGYKGERILLLTNSNYPAMRDAILVLSELMKTAGLNAEVQVLDWVTNSNNIQRGTGGWNVSTTTFTPAPLLGPQQWRNQLYNFAQIRGDAELDKAYSRFMSSLDVNERKAAWADIEHRLLDQAYFVKIADYGAVNAYGARVKGLRPWFLLRFSDVSIN